MVLLLSSVDKDDCVWDLLKFIGGHCDVSTNEADQTKLEWITHATATD